MKTTTLHKDFLSLSKVVRPKILKMAKERRLIGQCFDEFQSVVYPDAPAFQIEIMRTCFFAGVAELNAAWLYAADTETGGATDDDLALLTGINEEVEAFHTMTIAAASAKADHSKSN